METEIQNALKKPLLLCIHLIKWKMYLFMMKKRSKIFSQFAKIRLAHDNAFGYYCRAGAFVVFKPMMKTRRRISLLYKNTTDIVITHSLFLLLWRTEKAKAKTKKAQRESKEGKNEKRKRSQMTHIDFSFSSLVSFLFLFLVPLERKKEYI